MTRAFGSLLQGDVGEAMKFHPLAIVIALQLVVFLAVAGACALGSSEHRHLAKRNRDYWILRIGVVNFAAFIAVWAVRWRLGLLDAVV